MREKKVSTLTVPAQHSYLSVVRTYVGEIARNMGFSEEDVDGVMLATAEAAANVVEHAFLPEEEASFELVCEASSLELKVIVRDKGLPFEPGQVEKFSIDNILEGKKPAGLGFFLMEKSVDEFSFHNLGIGGKEIHLVKYIHQKRIEDYLEASKLKAYEQPKPAVQKPAEKIPYYVKLMEPSQAIEISQCAYRTYGYNYISEFIYYPERVVEMNRRGELISAVAVTDEAHEVMGHAALELDAERSLAELGVAFTKPQFRNQGCFNRIADYLLSIIKERGERGAYARAVTIHPYSQKALLRNGFRECGAIIGLAPATIFEKYSGSGKQRESVIVLFLNLDYRSAVNLYSPWRHRKILEKIYTNIEIPVQWADSKSIDKNMLSGKQAVIETVVNSSLMNAIIYLRQCGDNTLDEIRYGLKRLARERLDTIQLYLDLGDPFTAILAKDFEKMGFFFVGILPTSSRHNLILQYLNNTSIDYNLISTASNFASELLSYIKSCDPNV